MNRTIRFLTLLAGLLVMDLHASPGRDVRIDSAQYARLSTAEQERIMDLKARLEAVISIDPSELDREERKALRAEWKALKGEMAEANKGGTVLYISTAGIIIIILLLIILL